MVTKNISDESFVFDQATRDCMFGLYEEGATSNQVAVKLGLTKTEFRQLREKNPDFDEYCEYGENVAQAYLEDLALRGAKGEIRNFNNTMLQFLLKAQYPATYDNKKDDKDSGETLLEQLTAGSLKIVKDDT